MPVPATLHLAPGNARHRVRKLLFPGCSVKLCHIEPNPGGEAAAALFFPLFYGSLAVSSSTGAATATATTAPNQRVSEPLSRFSSTLTRHHWVRGASLPFRWLYTTVGPGRKVAAPVGLGRVGSVTFRSLERCLSSRLPPNFKFQGKTEQGWYCREILRDTSPSKPSLSYSKVVRSQAGRKYRSKWRHFSAKRRPKRRFGTPQPGISVQTPSPFSRAVVFDSAKMH